MLGVVLQNHYKFIVTYPNSILLNSIEGYDANYESNLVKKKYSKLQRAPNNFTFKVMHRLWYLVSRILFAMGLN